MTVAWHSLQRGRAGSDPVTHMRNDDDVRMHAEEDNFFTSTYFFSATSGKHECVCVFDLI